MYDENGVYFGFIYNGEDYYFIKNLQNDVEAISDKDENIVVSYAYDAWGNVKKQTVFNKLKCSFDKYFGTV